MEAEEEVRVEGQLQCPEKRESCCFTTSVIWGKSLRRRRKERTTSNKQHPRAFFIIDSKLSWL